MLLAVCIVFFFYFPAYFHAISAEHICFRKITFFIIQALIVLKPLVSLIGRSLACSARIAVDRHTYTHKPSTVTITAHAHQGLIMLQAYWYYEIIIWFTYRDSMRDTLTKDVFFFFCSRVRQHINLVILAILKLHHKN